MKNIIKVLFFLLYFKDSMAIEIRTLAVINDESISSYDLEKSIKALEEMSQKKIEKQKYSLILDNLISNKIKSIEINKNKINIDNKIINNQLYEKYPSINKAKISKNLKDYLFNDIKINYAWNILLNRKFSNQLAVNTNEIREILKTRNIPDDKKDDLITIEKNKKLVIISKIYFNKISSGMYVEKFK